ncbi:MAG: YbhB/YbcL family Raf kinase inhibitor-like protein [Fervidobacterium sp.]
MKKILLIVLFVCLILLTLATTKGGKSMLVTSAFKNGEFIPKKYACEGEDINPELLISNVPQNAKSIAIICDDPDAPIGTFVHWVIWNVPVSGNNVKIPEGLKKLEKLPDGTMQGYNDFGKIGYNGPCPPKGHGIHHYHFKVYALDTMIELKGKVKKVDLERAIKGHIIDSCEIIGLYERK